MTKVGPSIYGLHDKSATVALLPVALLLGDQTDIWDKEIQR